MRKTHVCTTCGRIYTTESGGTSKLCPTHYIQERRGGLKRAPVSAPRTNPIQVKFDDAEFEAILIHAAEEQTTKADWVRQVVQSELFHRAAMKRLGVGPGTGMRLR